MTIQYCTDCMTTEEYTSYSYTRLYLKLYSKTTSNSYCFPPTIIRCGATLLHCHCHGLACIVLNFDTLAMHVRAHWANVECLSKHRATPREPSRDITTTWSAHLDTQHDSPPLWNVSQSPHTSAAPMRERTNMSDRKHAKSGEPLK